MIQKIFPNCIFSTWSATLLKMNPIILNRELSWLQFNARVLHEAIDSRTPLLERVRFLGIFNSNLDEFFMKRVGGLKRLAAAQVSLHTGASSGSQLSSIREATVPLLAQHAKCFQETIRPLLAGQGIHLLNWNDLSEMERERANQFFHKNVFPVLTPLAVDPGHPFPFLSNLSTSLGVLLRHPKKIPGRQEQEEEALFARVKIPDSFPSWFMVDDPAGGKGYRFVSLEELISNHLSFLFPGMDIVGHMSFRVTRNADVERDEEDADDLLEMIEDELRERRFAQVVRLEHSPRPNSVILKLLAEELALSESDIYELTMPLDFYSLKPVTDLDMPNLKFKPFIPIVPRALADSGNMFHLIRSGDMLVHHPYESFSASVERFIKTAAEDHNVIAIKMTLYRTEAESAFIPLLIRAAEAGKQVVCLVELKARFDEERNILVAQELEKAGVHVVYGIVGLKTHCKVFLAVRREPEGVRCYAHIGTGNYNAQTARTYTDLGLFTANPEITEDVVNLFHYLTGRSLYKSFKKLLVAPVEMKDAFLRLIEQEVECAKGGKPAQIIAKMNSLDDKEIAAVLYKASQAGVSIRLIVRGVCALLPGKVGLSENIRVTSTIGRFLEHSRIFYFRQGSATEIDGKFYIGSSDWMHRNLSSRVEAVVPIEDKLLKEKCWEILTMLLNDQRQTWDLHEDGSYHRRDNGAATETGEGVQANLILLTQKRETHI